MWIADVMVWVAGAFGLAGAAALGLVLAFAVSVDRSHERHGQD